MNIIKKIKSTKQRLEFARAFLSLTANPNDTARVFKVEKAMSQATTPESLERVMTYFKQHSGVQQMLEEHYLAPDYKVEDLAKYAPGTLGYAYYRHMSDNGFSPDFFPPVNPTNDFYYFQLRLRQTHDIWHVITGFDPSIEDEIGLQAFYTGQLVAPFSMTLVAAGVLYSAIHDQKIIASIMEAIKKGWEAGKAARSFHPVKWEEMWERPLDEVRRELNVTAVSTRYDFAPQTAAVEEARELVFH